MDDGVAAFMRAMNDGFPAIETMSVSDARAVIAGRRLPVDNLDDVAGVDHRRVAGLGGDIPVRIYWPHGRNETRAEYPEIGRQALHAGVRRIFLSKLIQFPPRFSFH